MPNLVAPIRAQVLAQFPNATVKRRGYDWIEHDLGNGLRRFIAQGGGLHYWSGVDWQELNTDFVDSAEPGYADTVQTARFLSHVDVNSGRKVYPRRETPSESFVLGRPEYLSGVSNWRNLNLPARIRNGQLLSWDTTAIAFEIVHSGHGIKYDVLLKDSTFATNVRWALTLTGLTFSNWTLISNSTGQIVAKFLVPTMTDASGVTRQVAAAYDGTYVTFTPDYTGLTFPVRIDPTFTSQPDPTAGIDTFSYQPSPSTAHDTSSTLFLEEFATEFMFPLLKFDLSSLSGATVNSATLSLWQANNTGQDYSIGVYAIKAANSGWVEGATWDYANPSTVRWAGDTGSDGGSDAGASVSGADYNATAMATASKTAPAVDAQWDLALNASQMQSMIAANYGFLLRSTVGIGSALQLYSSDEATKTTERPKLVIDYTAAATGALATNVICAWASTAGTTPGGWSRDTALDGKYPKGTATSTDPGTTGGALTHSHTQTHDHTTPHTHTVPNDSGETGASARDTGTAAPPAVHTHINNPSTVNPTTNLTADTTTTDSVNHEPSYFEVIHIKNDGTANGIPNNAVALWSNSSSTPTNWNLCDGVAGRPNMSGRFFKGAAAAGDGGGTGGGTTHGHALGSHTHGGTYAHGHPNVTSSTTATSATTGSISGANVAVATLTHTHALTITSSSPAITGNTDTIASSGHEPPYTTLAAIQNNTGAESLPIGIICWWRGLLSAIPAQWKLCDGTQGTPDCRSLFVKIATTLGGIGVTGGSLTHGASHTATGHTHAVAAHTHGVTDSGNGASANQTAGAVNAPTATHTHTYAASGSTSFTSGTGTPAIANYTDTQPPFSTVAYIMYMGAATGWGPLLGLRRNRRIKA